jgi:hypothetical protein
MDIYNEVFFDLLLSYLTSSGAGATLNSDISIIMVNLSFYILENPDIQANTIYTKFITKFRNITSANQPVVMCLFRSFCMCLLVSFFPYALIIQLC